MVQTTSNNSFKISINANVIKTQFIFRSENRKNRELVQGPSLALLCSSNIIGYRNTQSMVLLEFETIIIRWASEASNILRGIEKNCCLFVCVFDYDGEQTLWLILKSVASRVFGAKSRSCSLISKFALTVSKWTIIKSTKCLGLLFLKNKHTKRTKLYNFNIFCFFYIFIVTKCQLIKEV